MTDHQRRPMIEVEDLHKYFGPLHVLRGIDLSVAAGEVVCIIGPSGSGKSTLLRCINHLEVAQQGRILGLYAGSISGVILEAPRGSGGFGYDPLFFYEPLGQTFGERDLRVWHRILRAILSRTAAACRWLRMTHRAAIPVEGGPQSYARFNRARHRVHLLKASQCLEESLLLVGVQCREVASGAGGASARAGIFGLSGSKWQKCWET